MITKTVIGVGSVERGAGTTCVSLVFANFICNKMGMKTAYIELNTTNQIKSLSKRNNSDSFSYFGIHIYPSTKVTSLSEILNRDYDFFVLDLGVLTSYTAPELSKCQKQFIVGDFCEWKKNSTLSKIKDLFQNTCLNREKIMILKNYTSKSTCLFSLGYHEKVVPFFENPFQLTVTSFNAVTNLLFNNTKKHF